MRRINGKKIIYIVLILLFTFVLSSSQWMSFGIPQEDEKEPKTLYKAVILEDFPPLYLISEFRERQGYAVEMAYEIAELAEFNLGFIVVKNWGEAMDMVASGKADFIPGIGVSDLRAKWKLLLSVKGP